MTIAGPSFDNFKQNFWNGRRVIKATRLLKDAFLTVETIDNKIGSNNVKPTRFFSQGTVEKMNRTSLGKLVTGLDKSLLETNSMQKLLGVEFTQTATKEGAEYTIKGASTASVRFAKALSQIPLVGFIIDALFEIPNIAEGFENGDGCKQIGRSAVKIGIGNLGMATAYNLASNAPIPTKYKGLFKFAASVSGSIAGFKVGKEAGDLILGESIKDQKAKQA